MSLTLNKVPDGFDVWGKTKVIAYDVVFDTSYPLSTGYVINAGDVGLKSFLGTKVLGGNKAAGALIAFADLAPTSTEANLNASLALRLFLPTGGGSAPTTLVAPVSGAGSGSITNGAISIAASTATPPTGVTPVLSTSAEPAIPVVFGAITQGASSFTPGTGLTAGIGLEVGNGTDVSSVIVRILFMGN